MIFYLYEPAIDIAKVMSVEQIMDKTDLGPNGGITLFCLQSVLVLA